MAKEVKFGNEARTEVLKGINKAVDAVLPTLGPVGMSAVIEVEGLDPIIADDGVTVLRNLQFKDRYENMGLSLARKVATQTSSVAGDGTSTASCLAKAIAKEAFEEVGDDDSKIPVVVERLEKGLEEAKEGLKSLSQEVSDNDIKRVATVASLDEEIGKLLADTIELVGRDGVISSESSATIGYSSEVVKGAKVEAGLISAYLVNNAERRVCDIEDVAVILVDRNVATNQQIAPLFEQLAQKGTTNILLIADNIEGEALATLVLNHQRKAFQICAIKNPFTASRSKAFLEDIAVLTGATVISEQAGVKLEEATVEHCGHADHVVSGEDDTIIVGGRGKQEDIEVRVRSIEDKIANSEVQSDIEQLRERIAALTGGIGVIRIGAYTDVEYRAKKYKIDNAINSTRSALEEGVLAGGGVSMKEVSDGCKEEIFKKALKAPIEQLAKNSGKTVKDFESSIDRNNVIGSHKVERMALENAVSIVKQALTIGTAIVNEDKDE